MGSGFDLGLEGAQQRLMQRRQEQEQQRLQQQNTVGMRLLDSINQASNIKMPTDPQTVVDETGKTIPNPTYVSKKAAYDQAQLDRTKLMSQYSALNAPEQHASFAQHLHGLIFGKPETNAQQPALSPNSSPNSPQADPNAPPAAAPPAPVEQPHPMGPAAPNHPLHAITGGIKALGDAIKNHAGAFANPLPPPQNPIDPALIAKYYRDPGEVAAERAQALWGERGQNALAVAQERTKALLAGKPPRPVGDFITIPHLIEQMQQDPDMVVTGADGHPYSAAQLSELPQGFLAHAYMKGNDVLFGFGDPKSKMWNIGGKDIEVPSYGPVNQENSTVLGTATGALAKTHQVPGMNPGETVNLTTKPVATPGMTGAAHSVPVAPPSPPAAVPPPGVSSPDQGSTPGVEPPTPTLKTRPTSANVPTLPPSPSQAALAAKTNAGRSQSKQIPLPTGAPMPPPFAPGTMLSQGRAAQPVVGAMSVVAANVFGGNGEKPLWDNAWMYDNPQIRKALNNALTLNALANPGTEDNPSLMQTLATAVGATQWSQEQINDANVQARQELQRLGGPEALKQFAREAALQEDLSALRAATKASAAASSIRTLVRAAPVYNISSSQDFRNQLGTTLGTAAASMRGYPAINPKYVDWWDRGVSAAKGGPVSNNAPKTPGAASSQVYEMGGKRYTYNGTGKKSDMANYTEVPSGR